MELKILGSSSAGNGYVFDNGQEALLVEAGTDPRGVYRAIAYDLRRLVGVVVSHEHGDHARYVGKWLGMRIPCYMSGGTAKVLGLEGNALVRETAELKAYRLGGFIIQGFSVEHDAAEPLGYLIHHEEMGTVLFATDTYYLRYTFSGLSNVLIECNYRLDILDENVRAGRIAHPQRDRTLKSHLSYDMCKETLLANDLSRVNNIVLIHLSPGNSHAREFQQGIQEATCKNVHIADKGMVLDFGQSPF